MSQAICSELLTRGDLAVQEGNPAALAQVVTLLSGRIGDPLEARLRELARSCLQGNRRSLRAWRALRAAIAHRISIAGT